MARTSDLPCLCDHDGDDDWADHEQWCPYSIDTLRTLADAHG